MRVKIVRRAPWERKHTPLYGIAGLLVGLAVCVAVGIATPLGASGVAKALFSTFTSKSSYLSSLPFYAPIALSAAGLALAYRAGFITIGAEGQVILGTAITYGLLIYYVPSVGRELGIGLALIVASLLGAAYGAIVGLLRAYFGANETLISLMMNFIAIAIVNYLVSGPWISGAFVMTPNIPSVYTISGITAAIVATIVIALLEAAYKFTRLGVAADSIGVSRLAAETYGVRSGRVYIAVAAIGGAAAGLGGALYALSINIPLTSIPKGGLGFGYIGILGAWLANLSIAGSIGAGLLLALLYNMTTTLQLWGIRSSMVYAFESILVLSVLFTLSLSRYRVVIERD